MWTLNNSERANSERFLLPHEVYFCIFTCKNNDLFNVGGVLKMMAIT